MKNISKYITILTILPVIALSFLLLMLPGGPWGDPLCPRYDNPTMNDENGCAIPLSWSEEIRRVNHNDIVYWDECNGSINGGFVCEYGTSTIGEYIQRMGH